MIGETERVYEREGHRRGAVREQQHQRAERLVARANHGREIKDEKPDPSHEAHQRVVEPLPDRGAEPVHAVVAPARELLQHRPRRAFLHHERRVRRGEIGEGQKQKEKLIIIRYRVLKILLAH